MARTAVLGFARIGPDRQLKFALEDFWRGNIPAGELRDAASGIRVANLLTAQHAGIDVVPVGDFAYYDHVLDAAELVGVIADRHGGTGAHGLEDHFIAACGAPHAAPLSLARWFDTQYHHLVPELSDDQAFELRAESLSKWVEQMDEARVLGFDGARPVLLGPFSLLALSGGAANPLGLLGKLTVAYRQILDALAQAGATEVQIDEPSLVLDHGEPALDAFGAAYAELLDDAPVDVALATYFGGLDDAVLARVAPLKLAELHVDLVTAPERLDAVLAGLPSGARLSAGVVDGRNVWAADPDRALGMLDRIVAAIGSDRLTIATSCSLLHVPFSAAREQSIDSELRGWLAFGEEKLAELTLLKRALGAPAQERDALLADQRERVSARAGSAQTRNDAVRARMGALFPGDYERLAPIDERREAQADRLPLPELPTTTLGSLPMTTEIRRARLGRGKGEISGEEYAAAVRRQIDEMIELQEMLELDVLVHGEPERRDAVEYFAGELTGFAFSEFGWVQTYGNRTLTPPILYGDVARRTPAVVDWWRYAQSLTERPVKWTLTGPVTILQRSFVRDDLPERETCLQIALALHDELAEFDAAGAPIIQIDEPALHEGLPLRRADRADHAAWTTDCVRMVAAPARPETRIHVQCHVEGDELLDAVASLDADVLSLLGSGSWEAQLDAIDQLDPPGAIGLGMFDVDARRIPSATDFESLLAQAEQRIGRDRLWLHPGGAFKTRPWPETIRAMGNLVEASRNRRAQVAS